MQTTNPIRAWRILHNLSLDEACDLFAGKGFPRPSTAKLSRIERDQDVPVEMIPAIEAVTGLPPKTLRPDLAGLFQ
jgi:hypothetical protein